MLLIRMLSLGCLLFPLLVWGGEPSELVLSTKRAELIEAWTLSPTPERLSLLQALQNGELLSDETGKAYLQQAAGVVDAETALPARVELSRLSPVPLNNQLRNLLDVALAASQLSSPEVAKRQAAIQTLQDAANPALLPLVEKQRALESVASLKPQLDALSSNMRLAHADPQVRLQALEALQESDDPVLKARIDALVQIETDPQVRARAITVAQRIQTRLLWQELIGHIFSGLSLGSILLLVALGLAITYGLLGVINMAHGELLMIGAYTCYAVQSLFRSYWPAQLDYYLLAALPAAFVITGLLGMALERLIIRHLYGRPQETLLATWGISLLLIQGVRVLFGSQNVEVANPSWMSGGWQLTAALTLPYNRIAIIGFAFVVLLLTWLLLNQTRLGLFIRAVTQNRSMAACVGVPTGRIDMLAFAFGSAIAGVAGVALSQIGNVGPDLGQSYIIDSFMVVVLGGVGQLAGSVIAALGLGVVNKILEPSIGAVLGKIVILIFIILFIQKKPMGLFALKGRSLD